MRNEEQLTGALQKGLSGVELSPWAIRRMTDAIIGEDDRPWRRLIPAWLVGLAVALATALWPLTAASETVL